jgi:hypothetical protein
MKDIIIQTDASKYALGCCMMQENQPVAYASKSLSDAELRYSQIEKEFLSILFSCKKFHNYIYGKNEITIQTDHLPLISVMKKELDKIASSRLKRIRLKLLNYNIKLIHVPGKLMHLADALSRSRNPNEIGSCDVDEALNDVIHTVNISEANIDKYKKETVEDTNLSRIKFYCLNGWPKNKNQVEDSIKFYYNKQNDIFLDADLLFINNRMMIPSRLKADILKSAHECHFGITKTTKRIKTLFYWPRIDQDVESLLKNCPQCNKYANALCKEPLYAREIPDLPFELVATDLFEFGNKTFIVFIDYYSKWIELKELKNKQSSTITIMLKEIFATHGCSRILYADNMPFNSCEFQEFASNWNFSIITSSPYHSKSNGLAEKAVHICKNMLRKT